MTPVTQTAFHNPEAGVRGNCFASAIASILDLPLHGVPAFDKMDPSEWFDNLFKWLELLGSELRIHDADDAPSGYAIANGMSPRGVPHSIVVHDGEMAHDPHPSRAGILSVRDYWQIVPVGTMARH